MSHSVLVVLLENNPIEREGISSFLRSGGFDNCVTGTKLDELGKFESGNQSRVLCLIDFDQERAALGTTVKKLRTIFPGCAIIVLAEACSRTVLMQVVGSGADGLLRKQSEGAVLVKSIELALLGERVFPADSLLEVFKAEAANDAEGDQDDARIGLACLSSREREILLGLEAGHSNKTIARTFGITESTVKVHVKAILRKALLKNRTQAAVWAKRARSSDRLKTDARATVTTEP